MSCLSIPASDQLRGAPKLVLSSKIKENKRSKETKERKVVMTSIVNV